MLSYNESINNYNENLYLDRNNIDEDITNIYYISNAIIIIIIYNVRIIV